MRINSASVAVAILSSTSLALAQTPPPVAPSEPARAPSPFSVSAGGHALVTLGDSCRRSSLDTVECTGGTAWTGLHLAPRWAVSRALSLGLVGALAWRPSSTGTRSSSGVSTDFEQRLWRVSAEARWLPFDTRSLVPWFGLEAGVASARDSMVYHGVPGRDRESVSQLAPLAAIGAGADWYLIPQLALGLELRGLVIAWGSDPPRLGTDGARATEYGIQPGVSLGLNLTFRP
ncbi:MAG TPA: hypothetical protein PLI95_02120 [Polyangiaceae bacterium]|nr:hypothetical protein [Polyangiaceae bacterium]